ncbi:D-hexose-6-phosphate mutarotase [Rheinheimera sp.]|uniref:D-hexose-6-phosphate mutarotase n=1 Tax=Rheinheimera sp. TaxID=1869214 RepID=UPI00273533BA|nr:D-hexose-6-phosphate mutarotase [Rheinheimera sp.]MDP2713436.1 D-hexose-6-phosphate mutarotase [Rheinheimera sp.]
MLETAISKQTGFAHLTDLPCIKLQHGTASAVVSLYGAQVLSYQPEPGKELLWLSPKAQWHNQGAIRGGVPVCWPWFGPAGAAFNPAQDALPNHGLVRNRLWQLIQQHSGATAASLTLMTELDNLPYHSGSVKLQLCLTLTDSLSIALSCNSRMPQQAALHSYFALDNIASAAVRPLPDSYYDKVSDSMQQNGSKVVRITSETDRIYPDSAAQLRVDSDSSQLALTQTGHDATVVWNPWQDKSAAIADLTADSYRQFICVETARLSSAASTLALTQQIKAL